MSDLVKMVAISVFVVIFGVSACAGAEIDEPFPEPTGTNQIAPGWSIDPVTSNENWIPYTEEIDGVRMALVPPGCFMMGIKSDQVEYLLNFPSSNLKPEDFRDQMPTHEVCFEEDFWIDVYEVTQALFAKFNGEASLQSYFLGNELPREQITWMEAKRFCEQRDARLPTEAEWEYAARGPDSNLFPWGNTFDCRKGNFDDTELDDPYLIDGSPNCDGYSTTAPVGSIRAGASWVGVMDLGGNVWEWIWDRYDMHYYTSQKEGSTNPMGPIAGSKHVVRGGAWSINEVDHLSAAFRGGIDPSIANEHLGFRCARSSDASQLTPHQP